jgi:hypothetical protein
MKTFLVTPSLFLQARVTPTIQSTATRHRIVPESRAYAIECPSDSTPTMGMQRVQDPSESEEDRATYSEVFPGLTAESTEDHNH